MKKVLVISYYYPPMGMGGVQRTAKFTKYLSRFGWQPHVLTISPKIYLATDEHLLEEVERSGVIIHRTGDKNGKAKVVKFKWDSNRKFLSNFSQSFLIPDSKILWKAKAVALAGKIINENKIDLIYSTAPPYTDFIVASELKNKFNIPLVLDYRDSWIDCPNNYYPTPFHKKKHMSMEIDVLRSADSVITINERIKELILEKYGFVKDGSVKVIPHGFDQDDFNNINNDPFTKGKFTITYSGSFLNYYTPKYFLDALKIVFDIKPGLRDKIQALFVGYFPDEYKNYAKAIRVFDSLKFSGYVNHGNAIRYLVQADVLWMMIRRTSRSDLHSTGKLYEYFGARKPIIACVPEGTARKTLSGYGAVKITEPDDPKLIASAIQEYYDLYAAGSLPVPDESFISGYDREKLTGELAGEFNNVVSTANQPSLNGNTGEKL